jgi:hypothetical protein
MGTDSKTSRIYQWNRCNRGSSRFLNHGFHGWARIQRQAAFISGIGAIRGSSRFERQPGADAKDPIF